VKRIGRWAFNMLAGVSLVLCLATMALWVRSHWLLDSVHANPSSYLLYGIRSDSGRVWFDTVSYNPAWVESPLRWTTHLNLPSDYRREKNLDADDYGLNRWGFVVADSARWTKPIPMDVLVTPFIEPKLSNGCLPSLVPGALLSHCARLPRDAAGPGASAAIAGTSAPSARTTSAPPPTVAQSVGLAFPNHRVETSSFR
jgi:hypothetical protein